MSARYLQTIGQVFVLFYVSRICFFLEPWNAQQVFAALLQLCVDLVRVRRVEAQHVAESARRCTAKATATPQLVT